MPTNLLRALGAAVALWYDTGLASEEMDTKAEVEMTDEEIDALVAAVSDELGPVTDDAIEDDDYDDDEFDISIKQEPFSDIENNRTIASSHSPTTTTNESHLSSVSSDTVMSTKATAVVNRSEPETCAVASDAELPTGPTARDDASSSYSSQSSVDKTLSGAVSDTIIQKNINISDSNSVTVDTERNAAGVDNAECSRVQQVCASDKTGHKTRGKEVVPTVGAEAAPSVVQSVVGSKQIPTDAETVMKKSTSSIAEKKTPVKESPTGGGGWGWGSLSGWGSSVISSATAITSHVGESLYHVLEKVESTLVEPVDNNLPETDKTTDKVDDNMKMSSSSDRPTVTKQIHSPGSAVKEPSEQKETLSGAELRKDDKSVADNLLVKDFCAEDELVDNGAEAAVKGTERKKKKAKSGNKSTDDEAGAEGRADDKKEMLSPLVDDESSGWLSGWDFTPLSQLTGAVKKTGKRVVSTGLGVIGDISKKTYMALMEDDEETGTVLQESAKKKSDSSHKMPPFFITQDDGSGEAHMEALQELSSWSSDLLSKQIGSVPFAQAEALRDDLSMIQEAFNLSGIENLMDDEEREHDFVQLIKDFVSQLGLKLDLDNLLSIQDKTRSYIGELSADVANPKEIHQKAVKQFAEFTAAAVALYHKIGQLLLVEASVPLLAYKFRSLSIAGLTKVLCVEIWIESNRFSHILNEFASSVGNEASEVAARSLATMIELESSNCNMSMQDACTCLLPIMKLVVARTHPQSTDCTSIAHMESLQLFSSMSRLNVKDFIGKLPSEARRNVETDLAAVETVFDLGYFQHDDDGDCNAEAFSHNVTDLVKLLAAEALPVAEKLIAIHQRARKYLLDHTSKHQSSTTDVHETAVRLLYEMTAGTIELFYSIAQLILLEKPHIVKLYSQKAENLAGLTKLLCIEIGNLSTQFTICLSTAEGDSSEAVTPFVTNVYLEASSSSTYVQDGFHLLLPVLQLALIKAHPLVDETAPAAV